ncbi:hypothetical protein M0R45_036675 [Rubus argutus]
MAGNFPFHEGPPFTPGGIRNEGTIPGVGVAMPLAIPSLDASIQGEQLQPHAHSMPLGAPPLPPGPHPSLLAANQQQPYHQNAQQQHQQHQGHQQMPPLPMPPPNMPQLQTPSRLPLLPHLHLRPHPKCPHLGMQGTMMMVRQLPQGHYMGMNPPPPVGGFPNGMPNMQGPSNVSGGQMYTHGGTFNHPQSGQMPMLQGYNPYQPRGQSGMPQPPPGPAPHGQTPQ